METKIALGYNPRMSRTANSKADNTRVGSKNLRARKTLWLACLILLVTFALRCFQLGYKSFWGDEIAQATWSAWEWTRLWNEFRAPPDFVLHFGLVHLAQQIGTNEFVVRLPSTFASVVCVPLTFVIAKRLSNRVTALTAMMFMAVAPYQIWYAQDARMYAVLCCFALMGLYFFLRVLEMEEGGWRMEGGRIVLGMTIGNTLAIYTHLFGAFPLASEIVIAMGILMVQWIRARKIFLPHWTIFLCASFALTLFLALPLVQGTLPYVFQGANPAVPASIAPSPRFQLTNIFAWELLGHFGLGAGEFWRTLISFLLALLGFGFLVMQKPRSAWIASVWLILPLAILGITQPNHAVAARYLIFLQPMFLMLSAYGISRMAAGVLEGARWEPNDNVRLAIAVLAIGMLGLIVLAPLDALYRRAKLNDWRSIAKYIEQHAQSGDLIFGERNTPNMNALAYYLPNLLRYDTPPTTVEAMQNAVNVKRRVWYISVGDYFDKEGDTWARQNFQLIPAQAWLDSELDYAPRDTFSFTQSEALAEIFFLDGELPSEIIYRGRQGFANQGTERLRVNPNETVEAKLKLNNARVLEIEFDTRQPAQIDILLNGRVLERFRAQKAERGKRTVQWAVNEDGAEIKVELKNVGASPLFLYRIGLK